MKVGNKILGVAVGQKSFLLAEVVAKGDRHAVSHCAEFVFPEGQSLSTPDKLGESFRAFLKNKQISTRDIVIGLPAKRLVTRRKDVPPASAAVAASTLRLQAEGEFSSELDNLIMDFAGTPSTGEATTVLIIATNKVLVDECEAMARAAGLRVHAITSTTAALGRATSRLPGGDGLVLSIGPNGAELVVQHGTDPAHLRHLNVSSGAESMTSLAGEIRRTMAAIPRNGTPQTLAVWSTGEENPRGVLEQRLSMPVTTPEVSNLVVTETTNTEGYGPAVSLALAAMEPDGLPVDFLHSRLAPPKPPSMSNSKKLLIAGGVLVAGLVAFVVVNIYSLQNKLDTQLQKNANNTKAVAAANVNLIHDKFVDSWFPKSKVNLDVLRDLTQLFPRNGTTIWVTSLDTHDSGTWTMIGKATQDTYIKSKDPTNSPGVVDKMIENSDRFGKVTWSNQWEEASGMWAFHVTFDYKPDDSGTPVATSPAPTLQNGRNNTNLGRNTQNTGNINTGINGRNPAPNNNNNGNNQQQAGRRGGGAPGVGGPGGQQGRGGRGGGGFGGGAGGFGGGGAADPGAVDPGAVDPGTNDPTGGGN